MVALGINNCFAVKRWPEPERWTEVIVSSLGLDSCQLSLDLLPPAFELGPALGYARRSRETAELAGLRIHSIFTGLGAYASNLLMSDTEASRASAEAWYRNIIEIAAEAGAKGAGGHVGALSISAAADERVRSALVADQIERMHRLAEHAKTAGLQFLLFENLAVTREYGHTIQESQEIEHALADSAVPWVLCLDLGHPAALEGTGESDDPVAWLNTKWAHQPIVQLQQAKRGADLHGPFTAELNEDGLVDRDAVLAAIANWNGRPDLFFEIIPAHEAADGDVLRDLKESVKFWKDGLAHDK